MSERAAARYFGISRDSVKKIMSFSVPPGYRRTAPIRRPKLDGFTDIIDGWLLVPEERERVFRAVRRKGDGLALLSGDIHVSVYQRYEADRTDDFDAMTIPSFVASGLSQDTETGGIVGALMEAGELNDAVVRAIQAGGHGAGGVETAVPALWHWLSGGDMDIRGELAAGITPANLSGRAHPPYAKTDTLKTMGRVEIAPTGLHRVRGGNSVWRRVGLRFDILNYEIGDRSHDDDPSRELGHDSWTDVIADQDTTYTSPSYPHRPWRYLPDTEMAAIVAAAA